MFYTNPADAAVDADALQTLADSYGERATKLPPVALVIAAYNEEGAVGPVVEALPRTVCGLAVEVIVVADRAAPTRPPRRPTRPAPSSATCP